MYTRWLRSACQSHGHLRGDRARLEGTLGAAHNSVNGDQSHGVMTISPAGWYHPWRQTVVDKLEPPQSRTGQCYPDLESETSWVQNVRRGLLPTPNPLQISVPRPGTLLFPPLCTLRVLQDRHSGEWTWAVLISSWILIPRKGSRGAESGQLPRKWNHQPRLSRTLSCIFLFTCKTSLFCGGGGGRGMAGYFSFSDILTRSNQGLRIREERKQRLPAHPSSALRQAKPSVELTTQCPWSFI